MGILSISTTKAGATPLLDLVKIMDPLVNQLTIISSEYNCNNLKNDYENIELYSFDPKQKRKLVSRALSFVSTQIKLSYELFKLNKNIDIWVFFILGDILVLPMFTSKLLKKKVILISAGSVYQTYKSFNDKFSAPAGLLFKINCKLADKIILYSPSLIKELDLDNHRNKIEIAHRHLPNLNKFKIKKDMEYRDNLIGYVGRLSAEKGILNLIKSFPPMLETNPKLKLCIIGDGPERGSIEKFIENKRITNHVELMGWVDHEDIPNYLNKFKLLVIPSFTEGLPNIMLEAMACGTPVLATPVGSIRDIISDGVNGFIMENNSSESIKKNILRALTHKDLMSMGKVSHLYVEKEFNYEDTLERFREILYNAV